MCDRNPILAGVSTRPGSDSPQLSVDSRFPGNSTEAAYKTALVIIMAVQGVERPSVGNFLVRANTHNQSVFYGDSFAWNPVRLRWISEARRFAAQVAGFTSVLQIAYRVPELKVLGIAATLHHSDVIDGFRQF